MKKMISVLAVLIAVAFSMVSFASDANQMKYLQVLPGTYTTNTTTTGSAVDVSAYKGNAAFVVTVGNSTDASYTNTVAIQHSVDGSTGWTALTNLAGTVVSVTIAAGTNSAAIGTVACDLARVHKYVRAVATQSPVDVGAAFSAVMVAPMKSE